MKIVAFLVFVVMPIAGIVWLFTRNGIRVTARIMGHKVVKIHPPNTTSSDNEDQFLPIVTFHDEKGIFREITLSTERPMKVKGVCDDEIRIIYPRGDPKNAKVDDWALLWLAPMILFTPVVLLAVSFAWLYVTSFLGH